MLRSHLQATATALFTKSGRTARKGGKGGKRGKAGKSTFAACKPGVICFQYREQGTCDNKECKGIHEGRSGKCCSNAGYLECGKCTDAATCLDVHIWDNSKWGDRNEAVSKWSNRMHKASALAGPLAMMYEGNGTTEVNPSFESEDGGPDYEEDFYLPGVHLSLCDGIGCAAYNDVMTGAEFNDYIAFETSDDAKRISYANFPWINYGWGSDVMDITESLIM